MANNRMCALQSLARSASVCGAAFCSNSSSEICVLIAESNCVHASLKRCLCSLFPICCHSCEWLLLPSSAENGEIRALTSNLFSNSISPPTARNIHQGKLFSPTLGIRLMFFSGKQAKKISPFKGWEDVMSYSCSDFTFPRKHKYLDTSVIISFLYHIVELRTPKNCLTSAEIILTKLNFLQQQVIIGSISYFIEEKSHLKIETSC